MTMLPTKTVLERFDVKVRTVVGQEVSRTFDYADDVEAWLLKHKDQIDGEPLVTRREVVIVSAPTVATRAYSTLEILGLTVAA